MGCPYSRVWGSGYLEVDLVCIYVLGVGAGGVGLCVMCSVDGIGGGVCVRRAACCGWY